MSSVSQQPINDGDGKTPLFPFGFGPVGLPGGELVNINWFQFTH